jgi:hypothetical protein
VAHAGHAGRLARGHPERRPRALTYRDRRCVAVYTGRNFTGSAACIRLGQRGDLRGGFVNNVESYRWITPATCNTIPSALK